MAAWTGLLLLFALGGVSADTDAKDRPVSRVISLLKDMTAQMEKEGEEDEEVYESMGCWCETNDKAKTEAIAEAKEKISKLTALTEELTATAARLTTEIDKLTLEVAKNKQTIDASTALRAKQLKEFNEEEKDMLQSITSMKSAIVSLSKHHKGAALLQNMDAETIDILTKVQADMFNHIDLLREVITPKQQRTMKSLIAQHSEAGYAPQSSEIFGILKQMKETFETNLATSQKDEAGAQKAFEDLKASKTAEIEAGQSGIDAKTDELATTEEKNVASKQDLDDTSATLASDTKFLADVKDKCANADQEFAERTKTRQLEIAAVSKALEYLSSDEAHELFTKTFNPTLLQLRRESKLVLQRKAEIVKTLQRVAQKAHDPRLSELAVKARMDAFANLKKTIQDMVDRLLKEKDDEIKHKDFCVDQINENTRETQLASEAKDETEAKVEDLKMTVDSLKKEITELKEQIEELMTQMKMAGEDREKENKDFQVVVADQRATQKLLGTALGVLKGFYEKAALVQSQKAVARGKSTGAQGQPAFKSYEKNQKSGGVIGMIEGIIKDAKALESEAVYAEEAAQKAYEAFCLDTNEVVAEKQAEITDKSQVKGKTEGDQLDREVELDKIMETLAQLDKEKGDISRSCDFLLKNWEVRTTARDQEIEGLKQGIALFSGAKMAALLENLGH